MKHGKVFLLLIVFLIGFSSSWAEEFERFSDDSRLDNLSPAVRCLFDAASVSDSKALASCLAKNVSVNIAGMQFSGPAEVVAFAERDVWGGKYKVEKVFRQGGFETVHCRFWPRGWSSPEPPIEYKFKTENGKILLWQGKYR